ncbi:GDSL esterase/lipase At5g45670-like [Cornus florida]|uniref:GDSL esterase/lipase At5g45670-like n=1 Tax=Cornus florida TaxID=4283 RepID=UPI00289C43C5|nr:GDSL esterase/lipase At5g45670-like [Cornus florida]
MVANLSPLASGEPQVPCYFIFGDSLTDNGNNNPLLSLAKVNFPPYGIDCPDGPTGRFTNGRTTVDIIAELLGFTDRILPFVNATGTNILRGVNYASGGGGIRDETGTNVVGRFSMNGQLANHQVTLSRIATLRRSTVDEAKEYVGNCIYSVGMGSNDYINNYLMPQIYPTSTLFTPDQYAAALITQYEQQLRTLYAAGARKVALFDVGPIGCTPAEIATFGTNGSACVDFINAYVTLFNTRLKTLVDQLNYDLNDAKFIYINTTHINSGDPSAAGITILNAPCCSVSPTTGLCIPNSIPCSNRSIYAFWDTFHPTEIVNRLVAPRAYSAATPMDTYPIDIRCLAQLQLY